MSPRNHLRRARVAPLLIPVLLAMASLGFAQAPARIQSLISSGNLAEMRWPNFRDYQPWLQKFYEPSGFAPAWLEGNAPSAQSRVMIELFRNAWKKGLEPEDYDASRWEGRLRNLEGPSADGAAFDVALSVCTMRYVSDLRIGRINPKHANFDLSI